MKNQPNETHLHDVTDSVLIKDYVVRVRFDDGTERVIDFEPILIGPLFGPLRDPALFRQLKVDAEIGTIVWPTGADIDPNVLYDWPQHVDAIVLRRRRQWPADYSAQRLRQDHRAQIDRSLQKVAEANEKPYAAEQPGEEAEHETD